MNRLVQHSAPRMLQVVHGVSLVKLSLIFLFNSMKKITCFPIEELLIELFFETAYSVQ